MTPDSTDGSVGMKQVGPLNLTAAERRTLLHCIVAGEKDAIEHFGDDELERVKSIKQKLDYSHGVGFNDE